MATCLIVQHAAVEEAYAFAHALTQRDVRLDTRSVFAGATVPESASGFDGVVVMGGPASATSDEHFPSRRDELALLADAVGRKIPTLGVCLGAQLLAAAAGGQVVPGNEGPEIGWAPIDMTPEAAADPLLAGGPPRLTVLHWHSDTFTLPPGAARLASSALYENQAFRVGDHAWGLQFHLEVDVMAVSRFVGAFGREIADPMAIERDAPLVLDSGLAAWGGLVARRFAELVTGRSTDSGHSSSGSLSVGADSEPRRPTTEASDASRSKE